MTHKEISIYSAKSKINSTTHSWFATEVDGNELGPVYLVQLKQLKYEDPSDEWIFVATMDFMIDIW